MDFPSCAEVWRCLLCWCRDTGTVLTWRVLPELKQLVSSTATEKKKKKERGLKFYWSPAQSVPHILSVYGRTPLPLTSPHFVSHSVYISLSVSHLLFHHILHLLHPASSVVSVKLIPVLPQIPPPAGHVWRAEPKCHKENMIPT